MGAGSLVFEACQQRFPCQHPVTLAPYLGSRGCYSFSFSAQIPNLSSLPTLLPLHNAPFLSFPAQEASPSALAAEELGKLCLSPPLLHCSMGRLPCARTCQAPQSSLPTPSGALWPHIVNLSLCLLISLSPGGACCTRILGTMLGVRAALTRS